MANNIQRPIYRKVNTVIEIDPEFWTLVIKKDEPKRADNRKSTSLELDIFVRMHSIPRVWQVNAFQCSHTYYIMTKNQIISKLEQILLICYCVPNSKASYFSFCSDI